MPKACRQASVITFPRNDHTVVIASLYIEAGRARLGTRPQLELSFTSRYNSHFVRITRCDSEELGFVTHKEHIAKFHRVFSIEIYFN
jgi:hypothetical protein